MNAVGHFGQKNTSVFRQKNDNFDYGDKNFQKHIFKPD